MQLLSSDSIAKIIKRLESDNAISIIENLSQEKKNAVLDKLPPKDRFLLEMATGTGKTLSIICSLLALNKKRIIYTSRTHS